MWTGFIASRQVLVVGSYERSNEPTDFLKMEKFLDWLSDSFKPRRLCSMD
jgi:hypothetical protein